MAIRANPHHLDSLYRDLQKLTRDLSSLKQGKPPSAEELLGAPLLDQWSFGFLPAPCLVGAVYGHPGLGTRPNVHTSELVIIDPNRKWARTWSRLYRLGDPVRDEIPAGTLAN